MKIILLNGPPKSGKSTVSRLIEVIRRDVIPMSFAAPLRKMAERLFLLTDEDLTLYKDSGLCGFDEAFSDALSRFTPRGLLIALSENFAKPTFGKDFFGRLMASKIGRRLDLENDPLFVIDDYGFIEEAQVLVARFGRGAVKHVHVLRLGTDFENDSRSYWRFDVKGPDYVLRNNGTLDDLRMSVEEMLRCFGAMP